MNGQIRIYQEQQQITPAEQQLQHHRDEIASQRVVPAPWEPGRRKGAHRQPGQHASPERADPLMEGEEARQVSQGSRDPDQKEGKGKAMIGSGGLGDRQRRPDYGLAPVTGQDGRYEHTYGGGASFVPCLRKGERFLKIVAGYG